MGHTLALMLMVASSSVQGPREEAKPLVRWSFEHDDGWQAQGATMRRSKAQARDGGSSLRLDVRFPEHATAFHRLPVDLGRVGRLVYHLHLPADAPSNVQTMLFVKDKNGLWFQHAFEQPLRQGGWSRMSLEIDPDSPHLRPSGHHAVWDAAAAEGMVWVGVRVFSPTRYAGAVHLDRVLAFPADKPAEPLRVLGLRENALKVGRYEKFEATFELNRGVRNPFDPERVRIDATFRDAEGKALTVPAFYTQDFVRRLRDGREELTPVGRGAWKVRFAPMTAGRHTWSLTVVHDPGNGGEPERLVTGERSFECVPSKSRGFVRVCERDPHYFELDDGSWFYPIGHNVHSPSDGTPRAAAIQQAIGAEPLPDHGTFACDRLFAKMAAHGENFVEVWMAAWWLGLEWLGDWKHYRGLTRFNLRHAWKLDRLVDLAGRHGLYIHLVLDNHGKASTWCDSEWADSPYNRINGGFLDSPEQLFSDPVAKAAYKKKLRYLVARWGYSTRVAGLELWSEIDLVGDGWDFHAKVERAAPKVAWHREMTDYLDAVDPWGHLVTTHFSTDHARIKSTLAGLPGLDYNACDAYKLKAGPLVELVTKTADTFASYGKPGIVTEYGGRAMGGHPPDELRADLHAGLWATYMTHAAGTPLLWWHQFIDADGLYGEFQALAAYHKGEDRRGEGLTTRPVQFSLPRHNLGGLVLQNEQKVYAWVYATRAVRRLPRKLEALPEHKEIGVGLAGLENGKYHVEVWDTRKGIVVATHTLSASGGGLTVPLPPFRGDIALKARRLTSDSPED